MAQHTCRFVGFRGPDGKTTQRCPVCLNEKSAEPVAAKPRRRSSRPERVEPEPEPAQGEDNEAAEEAERSHDHGDHDQPE